MSFANLLRRSNFITHDPLITRVYTSPPSSLSSGDFGLKSPLWSSNRRSGRYISVSNLDAGPGVGAEWRSAEKEARFVDTWGSGGKVTWIGTEDEEAFNAARRSGSDGGSSKWERRATVLSSVDKFVDHSASASTSTLTPSTSTTESNTDPQPPSRPRIQWMPDVESMTEKEFAAYLANIRSHRRQFQSFITASHSSSSSSPNLPSTLPEIVSGGMAKPSQPPNFLSFLQIASLSDPSSTRLHSKPHRTSGLSYSPPPAVSNFTSSFVNASPLGSSPYIMAHKGRILDRYSSGTRASRGGISAQMNSDFVIGIGGLTAFMKHGSGSIRTSNPALQSFDLEQSVGRDDSEIKRFRIAKAHIKAPPSVLGLGKMSGARWTERESAARIRSPFDTFRFGVEVEFAHDLATDANTGMKAHYVVPGSPEAIAREGLTMSYANSGSSSSNSSLSASSSSSYSTLPTRSVLGSPRASRIRGSGLREVKSWDERSQRGVGDHVDGATVEGNGNVSKAEVRQQNVDVVKALIKKIGLRKAQNGEEDNGKGSV